MRQKVRRWFLLLFICYGAVMLWLLFGREVKQRWSYNLIPFHTIRLFLRCLMPPFRPSLVQMGLINLFGNVILFVPLGFFPPVIFPQLNCLWKLLLWAFLLMLIVELLQMLLLVGTFDIDDLILNLSGTAVGYGLLKFAWKDTKPEP